MTQSSLPVLLVEDDPDLREAIIVSLKLAGVDFLAFESAELALPHVRAGEAQLLVTDFRLPGINGLELMRRAQALNRQLRVVVMTAYADTQLAIEALRAGANDFLVKPFQPKQLIKVIERNTPAPLPQRGSAGPAPAPGVVIQDAATRAVADRLERVARTDTTVLLLGESGVGKDVFARQLHARSSRHNGPYIAINCAAIPHTLLESTLFGHEKGAFTGAVKSQAGKFEAADGGTLFLDEIGEMPAELQAKLLRVLQDQVVERLGSLRSIRCNVRIVAASNRDMVEQVKQGRFREDLYFRLAVFPIRIPALRDRPGDVLALAQMFLERYGDPSRTLALSPASVHTLLSHPWPGNVRELENAMQRALLMANGDCIEPSDIELDPMHHSAATLSAPQRLQETPAPARTASTAMDMESVEREHILHVLSQVAGNRRKAVAVLGLSERTLRYKLKAYREQFPDLLIPEGS
jgi:two-component system response regulator FlrC